MSKVFSSSIILLILILVLLTGCLPKKKEENSTKPTPAAKKEQKKEENKGIAGSLKEIISLNKTVKCTWEKDENYFGVSWVKGKKYYAEITVADHSGQRKTNYMVMKDDCIWTWDKEKSQGVKMCFVLEEDHEMPEQDIWNMQGGMNDIDYKCVPVVITDAKFEVPSGIVFINPMEIDGY